MDEAEKLLIEVNERTKGIVEDILSLEEGFEELRGVTYSNKNRLDNLVQNGNFLLNSLIDRRIIEYNEKRGLNFREWLLLALAVIGNLIAAMAYFRP